jgi:two-component system nitrate/nitrite sensor histidine kinase NarX
MSNLLSTALKCCKPWENWHKRLSSKINNVRKTNQNNKYKGLLRWTAGLILILLILYEILVWNWLVVLPKGFWVTFDSVLLILWVGLVYFLFERILSWRQERQSLEERLLQAGRLAAESAERQVRVLKITETYADTSDESEVIDRVLHLSLDVAGAAGVSYVPLDDRLHPSPPVTLGEMPSDVTNDWLEYLASPAVRQRCSTCNVLGHLTRDCPLLGSPHENDVGIFCLPFIRGDQEYGVLNLYIPGLREPDSEIQIFLRKIMDEATLAIEGIRLQKRELLALRDLQMVREQTDLDSLLSNLLSGLNDTLEADFARLEVIQGKSGKAAGSISVGEIPSSAQPMIEGILKTVMTSSEPVIFGDISVESRSNTGIRALIGVPLLLQNGPVLGGLVLASRQVRAFKPRQVSMLQTISSQIALVVQYTDLMAEMKYKTLIDERGRLAREVHDGLAQTLGFLKLKTAQLKSYAEQGDVNRLKETIQVVYEALSDAYLEVRQTIDGLRLSANSTRFEEWLQGAVSEFLENSDYNVNICDPIEDPNLTPEVNAQLIRIVQEALNNVRKHSYGEQVWISCHQSGGDLILEVRDDGRGFDIEDVPGTSQHGLVGMRERADLIGADFQIISRPQEGTVVRVRLPMAAIGDRV